MTFTVGGADPVLLSLPKWTPGAYEIDNFARDVSNFSAEQAGTSLAWDKLDPDTWRVRPRGMGEVTVRFDYLADSLDNANTWSRPDFLLFNGTNLFPYPEGRGFDFPASVTINTEAGWKIATGMTPAGAHRYDASNYHDLVDMPFFVGQFDLDSAQISGTWVRFATYPSGSVTGGARVAVWEALQRVIPAEVKVFGEVPWSTYSVLQITDPSYGGGSWLEHQNSHVDVLSPGMLGTPVLPSLYAHEIFHAWNVKRLRPADLWPYRYDEEQPTPLLWISEGITDYYADLAEVRGGIVDANGFYLLTGDKMSEVEALSPTARRCQRLDFRHLVTSQKVEAVRIHDPAADLRQIGVVVGDSLADPQQRRWLLLVVSVRKEIGWSQALDVPGVKDFVRVEGWQHRRAEHSGTQDIDVGILVLEPRTAPVRWIGDLQYAVRAPRHFTEHFHLRRNHALERLPDGDPGAAGHTSRGICGKADPCPGDLRAVQIELSHEERHVYKVVIVRCGVAVRARRRHPGHDLPSGFGIHRY